MSLPRRRDASTLPLHVLFPESYEASARMIARDFAFFGTTIVLGVVGVAALLLALS